MSSYCSSTPHPMQDLGCSAQPNFDAHAKSDATQHRSSRHPLPFSALPHQLRRDLKGNQTAISLACALLQYAGVKPYCYPTTARLADDLGVCPNTIRAALRALQASGWIRIVLGANQPNGRRIFLCWLEPVRCSTPAATRQVSDPLQPVAVPLQSAGAPLQIAAAPLQIAAAECRTFEELNERNAVSPTKIPDAPATPPPLPRPAPPASTPVLAPNPAPVAAAPVPPAPAPITTLPASVGTQAPITVQPLLDELKTLGPGTTPGDVRRLAARLCAVLCDPGSLGGYVATLSKVVAGTLGRDRLIAAYKAGVNAVGKAQRPGALFMWYLANWTPPPKPSEIRYYQTPSPVPAPQHSGPYTQVQPPAAATPGTGVDISSAEMSQEELIALWRSWLRPGSKHPFAKIAKANLEAVGIPVE